MKQRQFENAFEFTTDRIVTDDTFYKIMKELKDGQNPFRLSFKYPEYSAFIERWEKNSN